VRVIRVAANERRERVAKFVEDTGITFPVLLDMDTTISEQYGIKYVPTTVIIGKNGKVRHVAGLLPEEDLRTLLNGILKQDR
jgi:peroxiredoxin